VDFSATILWFRQDLRLSDNPALDAAVARGGPIIPLYIFAPEEEGEWPAGGASKWWLHQSLHALGADLESLGSKLIIRCGKSLAVLQALIDETGADAVYWNRRYEPRIIERDTEVKSALRSAKIETESFNAALLFEPWEVANLSKAPYKVFTPYYRACLKKKFIAPTKRPSAIETPKKFPKSMALKALSLEPKIPWDKGMRATWRPGEKGAKAEMARFLSGTQKGYEETRNLPAVLGTSRLSPHLHFGELSPREIWQASKKAGSGEGSETYRKEIIWREFAHHLLFHFPHTTEKPLRPEFEHFPWRKNKKELRAWQKGQTGYPIVDAGMRELWVTGWMHNRVRMIVASFLIKDLLVAWQEGAAWFWDTLVDADLANNTLGWQWTAGCGADAAPFFRIFNPTSQGEKFDPEGEYVKKWCPELNGLPKKWLHRPWEAPAEVLQAAKLKLGMDYPAPIVDHSEKRDEALEAFDSISSRKIGDDKKRTKAKSKLKQQKLLE